MGSAEVWARILAVLGGLIAAGLVALYGLGVLFGILFGGMPDEEPAPAVENVLLVIKTIVVGVAAITLLTGAITARTTVIIGGCLLFILDTINESSSATP
ncbi:hypothetical protein [Nocardia sp. NPDC049707]|uniref:hypothetical protein n=1 Tax=Nocardia sp. NPDC049707 TaxID=3154735 RepID=UPI003433680E